MIRVACQAPGGAETLGHGDAFEDTVGPGLRPGVDEPVEGP
jgi:hypothetical protein